MKVHKYIATTNKNSTGAKSCTVCVRVRPPIADYWYSLSYLYFSLLGTLTTMVSGLLVSAITGKTSFSKLSLLLQ